MPPKSSFGEVLRSIREDRGLSQQALADKAGISQIAVSFYEQGKREPGWNAVMALCFALGINCTAFRGLLAVESGKTGRGELAESEPARERPKRGRPKDKAK
jgi:transcriptional regulator with XRE-family HTH domain